MKKSEKKVIRKIRRWLGKIHDLYSFWFIYDNVGNAVDWQGGFDMPSSCNFRNQYTIEQNKRIKKNYD